MNIDIFINLSSYMYTVMKMHDDQNGIKERPSKHYFDLFCIYYLHSHCLNSLKDSTLSGWARIWDVFFQMFQRRWSKWWIRHMLDHRGIRCSRQRHSAKTIICSLWRRIFVFKTWQLGPWVSQQQQCQVTFFIQNLQLLVAAMCWDGFSDIFLPSFPKSSRNSRLWRFV